MILLKVSNPSSNSPLYTSIPNCGSDPTPREWNWQPRNSTRCHALLELRFPPEVRISLGAASLVYRSRNRGTTLSGLNVYCRWLNDAKGCFKVEFGQAGNLPWVWASHRRTQWWQMMVEPSETKWTNPRNKPLYLCNLGNKVYYIDLRIYVYTN